MEVALTSSQSSLSLSKISREALREGGGKGESPSSFTFPPHPACYPEEWTRNETGHHHSTLCYYYLAIFSVDFKYRIRPHYVQVVVLRVLLPLWICQQIHAVALERDWYSEIRQEII